MNIIPYVRATNSPPFRRASTTGRRVGRRCRARGSYCCRGCVQEVVEIEPFEEISSGRKELVSMSKMLTIAGWWYTYPEKYESVNWMDYSQSMGKINISNMFQTTNQGFIALSTKKIWASTLKFLPRRLVWFWGEWMLMSWWRSPTRPTAVGSDG